VEEGDEDVMQMERPEKMQALVLLEKTAAL
jgi:hypothetical protein